MCFEKKIVLKCSHDIKILTQNRLTAPKDKKKGKDKSKDKDESKDEDELNDMFGNVDDAQYEEEQILNSLDRELCRGPFASIMALNKSILTNADKWPEHVQFGFQNLKQELLKTIFHFNQLRKCFSPIYKTHDSDSSSCFSK